MSALITQVEAILADLLDTYAGLRENYIHGDADDFHSLTGSDRDLALEVATYQNAARLIREHRDEDAGIGLPSWLWAEWRARERDASEQLADLGKLPRTEPEVFGALDKLASACLAVAEHIPDLDPELRDSVNELLSIAQGAALLSRSLTSTAPGAGDSLHAPGVSPHP